MPEKRCRVGVLARLAGVSPDSIRYYERIGILPQAESTPSGYRIWDIRVIQYLKWLGPARGAGFTLRELAEVFRMYHTGVPPCRAVRDILDQKLTLLSAQIEELSAIHSELKRALTQWNRKLRQPGCVEIKAHHSISDPSEYMVYGTWKSKKAWEDAHQIPQFKGLFKKLPLVKHTLSLSSFFELVYASEGRCETEHF